MVCIQIQSDNGSDLSSNLWRELTEIFKIKHSFSTIFHPETQSTLERFHRTVKSTIKAFVEKYPNNWDVCLPFVL